MTIARKGAETAGDVRKAPGFAGHRPPGGGPRKDSSLGGSRPEGGALRKKDTGESGNGGQFGSLSRTDADIAVPCPDPVEGMRLKGRSEELIATLCEEIDAERDGYAGALEVAAKDGPREYYLRPDGPDTIHAEYLQNRSDNYGTVNQAVFNLSARKATFYYDFDDDDAEYSHDERVPVEVPLNADDGPEEISSLLTEMSVDDGGALDQLKESAEDPDEAARDAYLRGIGVRRHNFVIPLRPLHW